MLLVKRHGFPDGYSPATVEAALNAAGYTMLCPPFGIQGVWQFEVATTEANRVAVEAIIDGEVDTTSGVPIAAGATVFPTETSYPYATQANSTDEVTVLTHALKGTMGTKGLVALKMSLLQLNNTGGACSFTVRIKLGATTLFTLTTNPVTDANYYWSEFEVRIRNTGGASTQRSDVYFRGDGASADGTLANVSAHTGAHKLSFENTAADLNLVATVQMSVAHSQAFWHLIDARVKSYYNV